MTKRKKSMIGYQLEKESETESTEVKKRPWCRLCSHET